MADTSVKIELNPSEALVLFEFLSKHSDTDELLIQDQAEQRVLWNICCDLEKQLVEPFKKNYAELLEAARTEIRDSLE